MTPGEVQKRLYEAPIGFAVFEAPDLVMAGANTRYLEMVARGAEHVGRAWADIFPELVGTPTHDAVLRAIRGESVQVQEFAVPLNRGGVLTDGYFSFSLDPTYAADGAPSGFVVIAVEVTELVIRRRQAEELTLRARASEARYRALFDAIDDGFCVITMLKDERGAYVDYRFLDANAAFSRHTGLVDVVGKTARELVPELDESWFRLYGMVAETGEAARFENDAPAMKRWFEVFASRIGEPELRQVGLVFKDVSARKLDEMEKSRLLAAEQTARRDAEAANRLKDEFLATVSHELRTPLHSMLGWLTLLRSGRVPADKTAKALDTVERNARAQAQLIEDLLDVSRILEGKLRLDVQPTDLREAIQAAVETVRPAAEAKGIRMQVTLASTATVMGDTHRLQQVIWNLLSNAVKFTPRDGRVQVVLEQHDSSLRVTVTDTGVGIPMALQPHVFERFRQAAGGSTRSHGGLGLGLSIVRHLTEMHGGTVSVFSEGDGRGASFTVSLPLALARRLSVTDTSPSSHRDGLPISFEAPPQLEGLDVLAVDDEEDSRDMLRSLLESCGAHVRTASSVREALLLLAERPPTVLLSDIGMPGEDGFALIEQVRSLPVEAGGDVAAVALTAYARTEDRTRCLLAGFNNHVPKPVEPAELIAVLASLARRGPRTVPPPGR